MPMSNEPVASQSTKQSLYKDLCTDDAVNHHVLVNTMLHKVSPVQLHRAAIHLIYREYCTGSPLPSIHGDSYSVAKRGSLPLQRCMSALSMWAEQNRVV